MENFNFIVNYKKEKSVVVNSINLKYKRVSNYVNMDDIMFFIDEKKAEGMSDVELVALYEEKEKIEQGVNDAEKEYYSARGSIDQLEKEERNFQHSREAIDTLLLELQGSGPVKKEPKFFAAP